MIAKQPLENGNYDYWMKRAKTYTNVNREELLGVQKKNWAELLDGEIREHFEISETKRNSIKILDIGAGPGFFPIILAELGYNVTAADFAEAMLMEARNNAGSLAGKICFRKENAMDLLFEDESFDVVLSRNLTWDLPEPERAYDEWLRVLKNDGLMMVFDANWYSYLRDDKKLEEYNNDRKAVKENGYEDYNIGENFDIMEKIAETLPLTGADRPKWDREFFIKRGISNVTTYENIGERLYSKEQKINFASTPMFMIRVVK